jgi:hypothetical protein
MPRPAILAALAGITHARTAKINDPPMSMTVLYT